MTKAALSPKAPPKPRGKTRQPTKETTNNTEPGKEFFGAHPKKNLTSPCPSIQTLGKGSHKGIRPERLRWVAPEENPT
jgi:hypothetical protein